jgi:hypothetical protein
MEASESTALMFQEAYEGKKGLRFHDAAILYAPVREPEK